MSTSADFTAYVVARWAALVRTLVLLGHEPAEADAIVVEALSRCAGSFDRVARESDVDVAVFRTVLATRAERPPCEEQTVPLAAVTVPDVEQQEARLRELRAELARLSEPDREATVLSLAADLDDFQVAEIRGHSEASAVFLLGHEALEAIPVRPAPVDEVLARWQRRRRRRTRIVAAVVVVLLVATAVGTWFGTRPAVEELPQPEVDREANPADLVWFANRELHLDEVIVELPQLSALVEVPDGAVVADREGRVLFVDQEGSVTRIGMVAAGDRVVGGQPQGIVAWVDVESGDPDVVVHDTVRQRELDRREVPPDSQIVALDGNDVFYISKNRTWSWAFLTPVDPGTEPGGVLVDIASRVRASQFSERSVLISQPLFDLEITVPGTEAMLSPDGDHVLTRVDFGAPDEVRIYEAGSGKVLPSGVGAAEIALAASFGEGHTVTYVIARRDHAPDGGEFVRLSQSGPHLLRTCDLDLFTCETVARFTNSRGVPVLPD